MGQPTGEGFAGRGALCVYLTGFGPFGEVSENPSATLVKELAAALGDTNAATDPLSHQKKSIPSIFSPSSTPGTLGSPGVTVKPAECNSPPTEAYLGKTRIELCGWEVLEVSADAATEAAYRIHSALNNTRKQKQHLKLLSTNDNTSGVGERQRSHEANPSVPDGGWTEEPVALALHFGVNMRSNRWMLETNAKNDARFTCVDAKGCRPQTERISCCMPLEYRLRSSFCLEPIAANLRERGFPCGVSDDAGCFVCNFLYFKSLQESQMSGVNALFVHVPPFSELSLQQQLSAALQLLSILAQRKTPAEAISEHHM
ncbi:chromatin organization modifier domain-containing protein, putative [Eimeria necatrix]|uniref:Pyroglutamyl-peptidase I n=1 Tax=Eimeria necatrix TaxID=51315 RepID=U6MKY4_9EIME|nr:chromatin organization modifier domain-containing protein, putative [Eimeria necatrix]CDJ64912.1 chromatin organization modifier domain-containing protein, putative [Eimeria necatrix]